MKFNILALSLFLMTSASSQVRLSKAFKCVKSDYWRDNYLSDGKVSLHFEFHNSYENYDLKTQKEFIKNEISRYEFKFTKTKDNLYVGHGKQGTGNMYVVIVPESYHSFYVFSKKDNDYFSKWSIWLLKGVRKDRGNFTFTDYKGNSCFTPM